MSEDTYRGRLTIEIDSTDKVGIDLMLRNLREQARLWEAAHSMLVVEITHDLRKIKLGDEYLPSDVIEAVNALYSIGHDLVNDPDPGPCTVDDGKDLLRIARTLDKAADDHTRDNVKELQRAMNVDTAVRDYIPDHASEIIIKLGGWK